MRSPNGAVGWHELVGGTFASHVMPTNRPILAAFRRDVKRIWLHALRRRGQNDRTTWAKFARLADDWLPKVRILHPWPEQRFRVKHPSQEPGALAAHARICAGAGGNPCPCRHLAFERRNQPRDSELSMICS